MKMLKTPTVTVSSISLYWYQYNTKYWYQHYKKYLTSTRSLRIKMYSRVFKGNHLPQRQLDVGCR